MINPGYWYYFITTYVVHFPQSLRDIYVEQTEPRSIAKPWLAQYRGYQRPPDPPPLPPRSRQKLNS